MDPSSRRPRSPPALMEELVEEILLRIPPDDPAHLRAALVCKPWRRILADPGFHRRHRARHPNLLGFFYNDWWNQGQPLSFLPYPYAAAANAPSLPECYRHGWTVLDCRHGRVLLGNKDGTSLVVWDPIKDGRHELQKHGMDYYCFSSVAVLCAVAGCAHRDCGGGPFFVVYLGNHETVHTVRALVYSSEACAWGTPVSSTFDSVLYFDMKRAAIIGDEIYSSALSCTRIVKYDLAKRCFSWFSSPSNSNQAPVLMQNEDGSLGLAAIRDCRRTRLHLWSRIVNHEEGTAEWVLGRIIKLNKILPRPCTHAYNVPGFAEGVGVLLLTTDVGTFAFQLKSGRVTEIITKHLPIVFPFITSCTPTPDCARNKKQIATASKDESITTVPN